MELALQARFSRPGVVLVGVVNAVGGSVLRSLLLHETPEVFRPGELTALASLLGCLLHLGLTRALGIDPRVEPRPAAAGRSAVTIAFVAVLRVGSVRYGLRTRAARGFVEAPSPIARPPGGEPPAQRS